MIIGWIKNLFKKKNLTNTTASGISTIDTSFIRVPKLSELSSEDRQLVKQYIQELKYDDYESVLKYSDELLNKSNNEIEFFMVNLGEIIKDISSVINEVNQENYFKLLLSKEEIKQSVDEFHKIINEATLRLIALDTYIKRIESLIFLRDRSKLLNERERLKITIKMSGTHLLATFKALKEQDELLNNMENYITSSKSFDTKSCNPEVCKSYVKRLLFEKELLGIYECNELESIVDSCNEIISINRDAGQTDNNSNMSQLLSNLAYSKLIPMLAKEKRELRKHAYIHRNDYKTIIDEINEQVKKYEVTSSRKWDVDELEKTRSNYYFKVHDYLIFFKNYLNDDVISKLKKAIFEVNYFYYISNDTRTVDYYDHTKLPFHHNCVMDFGSCNMRLESEIGYNRWDEDVKKEKEYYHKLSCDRLKKIASNNLPFTDYKNLESRLNKVVKDLIESGEFHYLFDIYNNDFEAFNLNLNEYGYNNRLKKDSGIFEHFYLKLCLQKIDQKIFNDDSPCHVNYESDYTIPLEEIYYLDKFLNGNAIEELFDDKYGLNQGMNRDLFKVLVYSYFKHLDSFYDDRILVIPRQIEFNQSFDLERLLEFPDGLNIADNNVAIYVNDWGQLNALHKILNEEETPIKYLMMTEKLYSSYRAVCGCEIPNIIKVPNDTRYSDLSGYLDKELDNTKKESNSAKKLVLEGKI